MTTRSNAFEECPHRRRGDSQGEAWCSLVKQVTGVEEPGLCRVSEDACRACCQSFPPSPQHLNAIVTSLVYCLTTEILSRSGVPGCNSRQAAEINELAARNVPFDYDQADSPSQAITSSPSTKRNRRSRSSRQIHHWAVGVTTAARDVETLPQCLDTLAHAGWEKPRIFVDGDVDIPSSFAGLPATFRHPGIGAWPSYYLAVAELLMREPAADAYLLVQDDVAFLEYSGLRNYLESVLWPRRKRGIASLYCPQPYTKSKRGWFRFRGVWACGAQAFLFSRDAAQRFVGDTYTVLHRWSGAKHGTAGISCAIGQWASRRRVPLYYPTPSLAQHIGHVSAIWGDTRAFGQRRAGSVAGNEADLP